MNYENIVDDKDRAQAQMHSDLMRTARLAIACVCGLLSLAVWKGCEADAAVTEALSEQAADSAGSYHKGYAAGLDECRKGGEP